MNHMMQSLPVRLVIVFLITLISTATVLSHPLSVSYSQFRIEGSGLSAVYRLPMDDMDLLHQLDQDLDGNVSEQELTASRDKINSYIDDRSNLKLNHQPVEQTLISVSTWYDSENFPYLETVLEYRADDLIEAADITLTFLTDLYPDHRTLAELNTGSEALQYVFQHENTLSWQKDISSTWTTAVEFVLFGIEHIFTGYDHILFLLGLLLVSSGLRNLVIIVTAFTIAHSLTLALATLGVVHPPGRVVEAAIALSIVYVGVENLVVQEIKHRWRLTFAFGLVHGFGFAGLLQELDLENTGLLLSLFTFNLGVEIGQVAIVAIAWPLLKQLSKSSYRKPIVQLLSLVITLFGLFWFFERVSI